MNEINKENLTKCPICKEGLYAYSIMGITRTESCYCPKCDIVKYSMMSIPFLCSKCHSRSFYKKDGRNYCWFCGNDKIVGMKVEEAEEKGFFETEGFKISGIVDRKIKDNRCKHEHSNNKRHNDTIFKFTCHDCGDIEFIMLPKWLQEENNIKEQIGSTTPPSSPISGS